MKYSFIFLLVLLVSCTGKNKVENYKNYLTDKVWMVLDQNKTQCYFSSKDNTEYLWTAMEKRQGDVYYVFTKAKGTPHNNPLLVEDFSFPKEGWDKFQYFRIEGNKLIVQNLNDIEGKHLSTFKLKALGDTTIGVLDYHKLKVTNKYVSKIWVTRIDPKNY